MNCFGDSGMADCSLAQPEKRAVGGPQLRRVVLNQAGRLSHRWSCPGALTPTGRATGSDHRGRDRVLLRPQGLSGTAGRGPACPVVWEAGGEIPPPTRFDNTISPFGILLIRLPELQLHSDTKQGRV
jgi:hypothetical protein